MTHTVPHYAPMNNVVIANAIRNEMSPEYRRRVPVSTQANIKANLEAMYRYTAGRNEFVPALINKIGLTLIQPWLYENPLAEFKQGFLNSGDTIEEIQVGLVKANIYDPTREYGEHTLFGIEALDVQTSYHKITRQEFYKVTVNDSMLRRAFLNDQSGLWDFVGQLMAAAANSDNADEYTQTLALLPEYYKLDGFFKVNVPNISDANSTPEDSKTFLRTVRELSDTLALRPVPYYNAARMPMVAKPEDLILFTTPAAKAAMDVEALAALFHVELAELPSRIVLIPAEDVADIPGFQGILTTRAFFVIADTLIETREQQNAAGLYSNYFFHHHSVISASRFVPAILLTTEPGDAITRIDTPVTGIEALTVLDAETHAPVTVLTRGRRYLAYAEATTAGVNDGVMYSIAGGTAGDILSPFTRIFQTGGLELSIDEASTSLIVRVEALDNPNGVPIQESTFAIVGTRVEVWPSNVFPDEDTDGLTEVTPTEPAFDVLTDTVTVPTVVGVQYQKAGVDVANGSTHVLLAATEFTATARAGNELATGATAAWTFTP